MTFELTDDREAYCYLKYQLEPEYQVVAGPSAAYYSEWLYCYRVVDGDRILHELKGDYRTLTPGQLADEARAIVTSLATEVTGKLK